MSWFWYLDKDLKKKKGKLEASCISTSKLLICNFHFQSIIYYFLSLYVNIVDKVCCTFSKEKIHMTFPCNTCALWCTTIADVKVLRVSSTCLQRTELVCHSRSQVGLCRTLWMTSQSFENTGAYVQSFTIWKRLNICLYIHRTYRDDIFQDEK